MYKSYPFLFVLLMGCGRGENNGRGNLPFDRNQWLLGDQRTRGKMVNSIIADSILIGKTKKEVIHLLGEQRDTTANFSYAVDIGLRTGPFGIGGLWPFDLNIHFDTLTSKVVEVRCND